MHRPTLFVSIFVLFLLASFGDPTNLKASEQETETPAAIQYVDECPQAAPAFESGLWMFLPGDDGSLWREVTQRKDVSAKTATISLRDALSTSSAGLVVRTLPNGARIVDLEGRFQSATTLTILPDGTKEENCVPAILPAAADEDGESTSER